MITGFFQLAGAIAPMRLRQSGIWSRGGTGWERRYRLLGRLHYYRRTEDQVWSPHYTERRVERGLMLDGTTARDGTPCLAWITVQRILKKPVVRT